jgi:hypothetical protein
MLRASRPGDQFAGTLFLRSPYPKEIEGTVDMVSTPPCPFPCRGMLERISPGLVVVTFDHGRLEPTEAYTVAELMRFQKAVSEAVTLKEKAKVPYPEKPSGVTAKEFAIAGLATFHRPALTICEHPQLHKPSVPRKLSQDYLRPVA